MIWDGDFDEEKFFFWAFNIDYEILILNDIITLQSAVSFNPRWNFSFFLFEVCFFFFVDENASNAQEKNDGRREEWKEKGAKSEKNECWVFILVTDFSLIKNLRYFQKCGLLSFEKWENYRKECVALISRRFDSFCQSVRRFGTIKKKVAVYKVYYQ